MTELSLRPATLELMHVYFQGFENDPALFADMSRFTPFVYTPEWVEDYFSARIARPDRRMLLVMLGGRPIGEVVLKEIDRDAKTCAMGIHLQNDSVKGKGYGTRAERLALDYAFEELGMESVFADCVLKNHRSRHVLEKVGFQFLRRDGGFDYFRCDRAQWEGKL